MKDQPELLLGCLHSPSVAAGGGMNNKSASQGISAALAREMRRRSSSGPVQWDPAEERLFPSSDGRPMADNTWQARAMIQTHHCLEQHFRHRQDVAVCIDLLVYYLDGGTTRSVAPDVFVAIGCGKRHRMTYKVWEEGGPPDFVLEVASPNAVHKDLADKSTIYARMGVREYWMFDPMGSLLDPRLQGFELVEGSYRELEELDRRGVDLARYSPVLELEFHLRGDGLRIWDPRTAEYLRTLRNAARAEMAAKRVSHEEARRRRAAERELRHEADRRRAAARVSHEEGRRRRAAERELRHEADRRRAAERERLELERMVRELRSKLTPEQDEGCPPGSACP